jgi:UDP-2,3-diacylglucosamine pyrophosphatase LpxH
MNYTDNYNLNLPSFNDSADISALNENFSKIDKKLKDNADAIANVKVTTDTTVKEGSTNAVSGGAVKDYVDEAVSKVDVSEQLGDLDGKTVKDYVDEQISNINITNENEVPSYWQSALDKGADNIHQAMESAGRNKSSFLFYSDAHWNHNSKMSPKLLKYLYKNTAMTKTFFGGDIVYTESTNNETMKYLYEWREMLKDLPNHHSVVGNHDDGNYGDNTSGDNPSQSIFDENYVYAYLLAPEENNDIVYGDGLYYYIDDNAEKTRYLFLDTAYKGVDATQEGFISNALNTVKDGWHIAVVAHIWYQPNYNEYDTKPIPIAGLDPNASKVITLLDAYNSNENSKGKVEFCIGGHVHRDYVNKTEGGIPIILVETDSKEIRDIFPYDPETTSGSSVNGIVCDYNTNKINVIRIGRGNSRVVDLITGEVTEIPNEDESDEPEQPTYTNVLDTVGYTENKRLSGGSGELRDNTGTCVTGFIPIDPTDSVGTMIYLKNVKMPDTDQNYYNQFACYDSNYTFIPDTCYSQATSIVGDRAVFKNGNLVCFRVGHANVSYIRITAQEFNENSIISVGNPIT